jgi:uncharacterized membrane protein YkvA (DUF1232 family)
MIGGRAMKIASVKARLTSEDILEAIHEVLKIEGLTIKNIIIDEIITVSGSYKKGVEIPFTATAGLGSVQNNKINVRLFDFKVSKVGILSSIKNYALKTILEGLEGNGITSEKDTLVIDLDVITKFVPYVTFKVKSIKLYKGEIEAEVEDITYIPDKEAAEFKVKEEDKDRFFNKPDDKYTKVRENIDNKVPEKYKTLVEYAMLIPDLAALLWRLFRDKRVEIKTKVLVGGLIAYIASPIDILPDFIPLIGKMDDVAVVFFAMNKIINEVPEEVIISNWTGKEDIIKKVREAVAFISKMVGSQNVGKLLDYVRKISDKAKKEEK